ncbi:MAG: hypothetical protein D6797_02110 [Bdellovibrio sp.]|nr:MAG: hypothetical protein D6797_02110 [Bdellovibrio sp.]
MKCPDCGKNLNEQYSVTGVFMCTCGWTGSISAAALSKQDPTRKTIPFLVLISTLVVAGLIHVINWDTYALKIIPLKVSQWFHVANKSQLQKIVQICEAREKWSCVEGAYEDMVRQDPENTELLALLGQAQMKSENWVGAAQSFQNYFLKKGKSVEVAYNYALVLEKMGQVSAAERYYKYILSSQKHQLQPKVMRSYVLMLMRDKQYKKASELIYQFRQSNRKAAFFMDKQLREIRKHLKVAQL